MPIRVVIADDHPLFLAGLERLLGSAGEFEVVGTCSHGDEAVDAVLRTEPDILVLDRRMPGNENFSVVHRLRREKSGTAIVLLTAHLSPEQLAAAVRLGVRGAVLKETDPKLLLQCLRQVAAGGRWFEREIETRALGAVVDREELLQRLTPREQDVVAQVARGLSNKEIGERLGLGEGTVKIHLHRIYGKLQVSGRTELAVLASRIGMGPRRE